KGEIEAGIPEHCRHVDGQVEEQALHHLGVVEHPRLQLRDRAQPFRLDPLPQPPADRGIGVGSKVESVVPENALKEQLDLEPLEIGVVGNRRAREGLARTYRYSHTRIKLRSCSVSTGFVM